MQVVRLLAWLGVMGGAALAAPFRPGNLNIPAHAPDISPVAFADVFPQLTFSHPTCAVFAGDSTHRTFVLEQEGIIRVFNAQTGAGVQVFADLTSLVGYDGAEMGLLGMALSPDFSSTREFFVAYTARQPNRLIVDRMKVSATDPNRADLASRETVIEIVKTFAQYGNHNGGMITFGPDGKFYIGVGDGGSGGDPFHHGQDKNTLWGKILRIDPLAAHPYQVPPDNPFVGDANAKGEVWAYGLRNPWRFSFDRKTGDLFVADVGQDQIEEIDIVKRGGNYGWNIFEGHRDYENPNNLSHAGFEFPIWEYPHGPETNITGGYVYQGSKFPELKDLYIYADFGSGRVWALKRNGNQALSNTEIGSVEQTSSFAEDETGEIYALSYSQGKILHLEKKNGIVVTPMPGHLSETGLFGNTAQLQTVDGLEEYSVNSPLWSDGAAKRRWIGLPASGKIQFSDKSPWNFPNGTVLVKHFELAVVDDQHQNVARRLETRVFFKHIEGWRGYTYKWNDQQTDADLLGESTTQNFNVSDATVAGGIRLQSWYFPGRNDCLRCHNFSAGVVLGVNTGQINKDVGSTNFLAKMNSAQVFDRDIGSTAQYSHYANPYDSSYMLQPRLRSYLAANCAQCHNPLGAAPGHMDFRYSATDQALNIVGVAATEGTLDLPGTPARVKPGSPEESVLFRRLESLQPPVRMPPLATSVVDKPALDLVAAWIKALPAR